MSYGGSKFEGAPYISSLPEGTHTLVPLALALGAAQGLVGGDAHLPKCAPSQTARTATTPFWHR